MVYNTNEKNKKRRNVVWICAILLLTAVLIGQVYAKYILDGEEKDNLVRAEEFYFTSNYMETVSNDEIIANASDMKEYQGYITNKKLSELDVEIYNYDRDNVLLYSPEKIVFDLTVTYYAQKSDGTFVKVAGTTASKTPSETIQGNLKKYTEKVESLTNSTLKAAGLTGNEQQYAVLTAVSNADYKKTLQGVIKLASQVEEAGDYYTLKKYDEGYYLLTVMVGGEDKNITVSWISGMSPDNTDPLMTSWYNATSNGTFNGKANTTYQFKFFGDKNLKTVAVPTKIGGGSINLTAE